VERVAGLGGVEEGLQATVTGCLEETCVDFRMILKWRLK
jgi:hypothetical protein